MRGELYLCDEVMFNVGDSEYPSSLLNMFLAGKRRRENRCVHNINGRHSLNSRRVRIRQKVIRQSRT